MKTLIVIILGCFALSCSSSKVVKPTNLISNSLVCADIIKNFDSLLSIGAEGYKRNHPAVLATKVVVISATCDDPLTARIVFQLFMVVVKNLEPGAPKYCVASEATVLVKNLTSLEFSIDIVSTREISTNLCDGL